MTPLVGTVVPPAERYDVALLDLDGVVYLGPTGISGAAEALAAARAAGMRLAFVTNNASRTPEAVAELLRGAGVEAAPAEVVTSAQAACHVLAERLPAGAKVLVVGGEGLRREAELRGFTVVAGADDEPAAVVQGYGPDVGWRDLAEATVAVRRGAWWVACNLDLTVPSARGPLPGNGTLVGTVRIATGVEPLSTGKPDPAMHRESVERSGARNPVVVGDRLDTDIEGASRVGCDSLLVPHPAPQPDGSGGWRCGGWTAGTVGGGLVLGGAGDDLDALRALCAAAWTSGGTAVRPDGDAAAAAIERLGLVPGRTPAAAG